MGDAMKSTGAKAPNTTEKEEGKRSRLIVDPVRIINSMREEKGLPVARMFSPEEKKPGPKKVTRNDAKILLSLIVSEKFGSALEKEDFVFTEPMVKSIREELKRRVDEMRGIVTPKKPHRRPKVGALSV